MVLEKELENKVQKINGFNNVGYIIVYYQLFFLDTMDFELALYYIRLLQFDRLQPRLSHLLKKLPILIFGVKFSIVPKRSIKGVQERAEYAYER